MMKCLLLLLITAELVMSQTTISSSDSSVPSAPTPPPAPTASKQETTVGVVKTQPTSPSIPTEISVPDGYTFSFALYGKGQNGYACRSSQWALSSISIDLINNDDQHFDPAFYVSHVQRNSNGSLSINSVLTLHDNSSVTVSQDASVKSPKNTNSTTNADWARYAALSTEPGGSFSNIGYVLMIDTYNGASGPNSECGVNFQEGQVDNRGVQADFYFYSGPIPTKTDTSTSTPHSGALKLIFTGYNQLGLILVIGFITIGIVLF